MPALSVIMPVYNCSAFISKAIESVLGQSFSDFEFIIIDDGSTDCSLAILKQYESYDKRIVLVSRENRGLVPTLNEMIDMATGTYIARMDADDICMPNRFLRQMEWLNEKKADLCGASIRLFGEENFMVYDFPERNIEIKTELIFRNPIAHSTVIARSDIFKAYKYLPDFEGAEDYNLWCRLSLAGYSMTNVPEILLLYRRHGGQITKKTELVKNSFSKVQSWYVKSLVGGVEFDDPDKNSPSFALDGISAEALTNLLRKILSSQLSLDKKIFMRNSVRLYKKLAAHDDCAFFEARSLSKKSNFPIGLSDLLHFKIIRLVKPSFDGPWYALLKRLYCYFNFFKR